MEGLLGRFFHLFLYLRVVKTRVATHLGGPSHYYILYCNSINRYFVTLLQENKIHYITF